MKEDIASQRLNSWNPWGNRISVPQRSEFFVIHGLIDGLDLILLPLSNVQDIVCKTITNLTI